MSCEHSLDEMETAAYDGLCPLCMKDRIATLEAELALVVRGRDNAMERGETLENENAALEAERDDYKLMYEQRVKDAERDYRYFKAERDRLREDIVKAKSALLGEAGAGVAVKILSRTLEESG